MSHLSSCSSLESLQHSVRVHGVLVPAIVYKGQILDGARRALCAKQVGLPLPTYAPIRMQDAARRLWVWEPERAAQFGGVPDMELDEASRWLAADPVELALVRSSLKRRTREPRRLPLKPKYLSLGAKSSESIITRFPQRLIALTDAASSKKGLSRSRFIRDACRDLVELTLTRADMAALSPRLSELPIDAEDLGRPNG